MRAYARRFLTETPDGDAVCVEVRLILTPAEEAALMAGYQPGQVPALSEDAALLVGVPVAEAVAALADGGAP